jgi:hypothetical protein
MKAGNAHLREAVMHRVDAAGHEGCRDDREQAAAGDTKARLLAFHIAARLIDTCLQLDPILRQKRRPRLLEQRRDRNKHHHHRSHDAVEDPSLAPVADHLPNSDDEGARQQRHRNHQHEAGWRGRVLIGVDGIGVEKPAAIGAECLIVSSEATGPVAMDCSPPWIGRAIISASRVCGEPCQIMNSDGTKLTSSSARVVKRTRSQ